MTRFSRMCVSFIVAISATGLGRAQNPNPKQAAPPPSQRPGGVMMPNPQIQQRVINTAPPTYRVNDTASMHNRPLPVPQSQPPSAPARPMIATAPQPPERVYPHVQSYLLDPNPPANSVVVVGYQNGVPILQRPTPQAPSPAAKAIAGVNASADGGDAWYGQIQQHQAANAAWIAEQRNRARSGK